MKIITLLETIKTIHEIDWLIYSIDQKMRSYLSNTFQQNYRYIYIYTTSNKCNAYWYILRVLYHFSCFDLI